MKTIGSLITTGVLLLFLLATLQRGQCASAPAAVTGSALVLEIQSGMDPFSADTGFVLLPKSSGNGLTIAGIPSAPDAAGTYTYTPSGSTASMNVNVGAMGTYYVTFTFSSDYQGTFSLNGNGRWANGRFLYLSVPVPSSLVGSEFDMTPDPTTSIGTGRLVMSSSGTACTLYAGTGAVVGQGSYTYARLNPCLGKLVLSDPSRGKVTAYFGLYQGNTGFIGVEGMSASDIVQFVLVDRVGPKVAISSPAAGARILQLPVVVQGTASDNTRVAGVSYTVQNANGTSAAQTVVGTTSWTATLPDPVPGTNVITVTATDTDGNVSAPVSRSFVYVASSPLTVSAQGTGSFTPDLNGQYLEIGKSYSMTAKPGAGYLFGVWSDGQTSYTTPTLQFTMSSNLVLQATFITNQFPLVTGSYNGMFPSINQGLSEPAPIPSPISPIGVAFMPAPVNLDPAHAGSLSLTVDGKGAYTAKVRMGAATYSFASRFDAYGFSTRTIARKGAAPLVVNLQIGFNGEDMVVGNIGDGVSWTNTLSASRSVYSISKSAPLAGRNYTFILPTTAETGAAIGPFGYSHGTLKISTKGTVALSGRLADGTPISQSTTLSKDVNWPLYIPLYQGGGLLAGWMSSSSNAVTGDVLWITPTNPAPRYCGAGFSYRAPMVSSPYVASTGAIVGITNAEFQVIGGDLLAPFTNRVQLTASPKALNLETNKLTLTFVKPTGLFSGSVVAPGSTRAIPFKGVVLQNQNSGAGYFLGTNSMGSVLLSPQL